MSKPVCLNLGQATLPWVESLDYLGITISSHHNFNIDLTNTRRKFFRTVNQILSKCSHTSDLVKLSLLESYALPILLCALESLNLPTSDLITINTWWNSVYRKIFQYNKWESVRLLISYLHRLDFLHLCNLRTISFSQKMLDRNRHPVFDSTSFTYCINNTYCSSNECFNIFNKCNCSASFSFNYTNF